MRVRCDECGSVAEFYLAEWRCPCGGAWEPAHFPPFETSKIIVDDYSIWRYGKMLGLDIKSPLKRMGVGWTPLVPVDMYDLNVNLKLAYFSPSGSFKDRGVNAMVNQLVFMGAKTMVEDSSGNAGASLAAHSARFGIKSKIFMPDYASPSKLAQISIYGVEVVRARTRKAAEDAAQACAGIGKVYASHAYNPAYLVGQMTAAWEIWEQLGQKAPDWIFCPVAQGGLFLGLWFGFKRLFDAGLIERLPKLVAVQSAQIAPIYEAWRHDQDQVKAVEASSPTVAEGVAISRPARGRRILQALKDTDGKVLAIGEGAILRAQEDLAHLGYYVEPTSALAVAGLKELLDCLKITDTIVIPLTGNGLKGKPKYQ